MNPIESVPILCGVCCKELGWTATSEAAQGWYCEPCKRINELFVRVTALENQ